MPVITAPVNHAVSAAGSSQRQLTAKDEIFEILEQERRKYNLILFNMSVSEYPITCESELSVSTSLVNQAHCFVVHILENLFLESRGLF